MLDNRQHLHQREHRRDRLKQLRAFCHAARFGNISRAAERILSSQPAVSTQVRTLEEELGVQLFRRDGPRIYLTQFGQNLYKRAMPLVQGMDRLPDTFAEEHYGDVGDALKTGAGKTSAAYLLPEYLERFRAQYPGTRIEIPTGTGQQRIEWLRDYELDIVIAAVDIPPADVDFHPVLTSEPVLITAEDHALARRESVAIEDIARNHDAYTTYSTRYLVHPVGARRHGGRPCRADRTAAGAACRRLRARRSRLPPLPRPPTLDG